MSLLFLHDAICQHQLGVLEDGHIVTNSSNYGQLECFLAIYFIKQRYGEHSCKCLWMSV